ncbi:hypothetical protein QC823_10700 [Halomonas vilamensis]|uniref:Uncharacterized protein n=1 Tax=Vreelandella vilamensis TaxID=531309 RepID=A0ABU1H6Z9_9GAMM|nr:hypothetical protein [Halomonas vilamensis]MDR5899457.1 hypothetical protein [Halomonas vilamensis]
MISDAPSLDRRIFELLQQPENAQFTVCSLRDAYAQKFAIEAHGRAALRRFIYEHLVKLLNAGLVEKDAERRKRDQLFHVASGLKGEVLNLEGETFEVWHQRLSTQQAKRKALNKSASPPSAKKETVNTREKASHEMLEKMLKEVQRDFLETLGETEIFQKLIQDYPELGESIGGEYKAACDRSSRLLGHVSALEKAIQRFSADAK